MQEVRSLLKDFIKTFSALLLIAVLLFNFVLIPASINGGSMKPTLNENQYGVSFIFTKWFGIKRFDICVINVDDKKMLVKRAIGLPNEKIEYKNNILYINGEQMDEDFLPSDTFTEDFSYTLKDNEYFLMGDHRSTSHDSRDYGAFNLEDIKATHFMILYPFKDFGIAK